MTDTASELPERPLEASREQLLKELEELRTALLTRDIIGQAKGVIRLLTATDATTPSVCCARSPRTPTGPCASLLPDRRRAGIGQLLPADVMTSWQRHVGTPRQSPEEPLPVEGTL